MRIPPPILIGCIAIFVMVFVIFFILENFLKLNNILEETCKAENDELGIEKGKCQLNLMVSKLIAYLSTFIIACFIGITGFIMVRNYRSVEGV